MCEDSGTKRRIPENAVSSTKLNQENTRWWTDYFQVFQIRAERSSQDSIDKGKWVTFIVIDIKCRFPQRTQNKRMKCKVHKKSLAFPFPLKQYIWMKSQGNSAKGELFSSLAKKNKVKKLARNHTVAPLFLKTTEKMEQKLKQKGSYFPCMSRKKSGISPRTQNPRNWSSEFQTPWRIITPLSLSL